MVYQKFVLKLIYYLFMVVAPVSSVDSKSDHFFDALRSRCSRARPLYNVQLFHNEMVHNLNNTGVYVPNDRLVC